MVRLGQRRKAKKGESPRKTTAEQRMIGYQDTQPRHKIAVDPALIRVAANLEADGARAADELLRSGIAVTAIVTMTDNIAIGAYRAARALGIKLPEELSIVGFDDAPVVGDLTPALTTVHPPFFELGVRAAEIALDLAPAGHVLLPVQFMNRDSAMRPKA
jgi:LacI family transcriptional regulator